MKKLIQLTLLNFLQGSREKIFWLVFFFYLFILAVTFFMGILSVGETAAVLRSAGLLGIEIIGLLLIAFSLTFGFHQEKDNHMPELMSVYFSRPVYIGSKLLSYLFICLFYLILAGLGLSAILIFNKAFAFYNLIVIFSIFLKLSIITGFALVFSVLFGSALMAFISTLSIYIASEVSKEALRIVSVSGNKILKSFFDILYYILPNMDKLDLKTAAVYGKLPPFAYLTGITSYTIIYILFLWLLAALIFLKKEL